MGQYFVAKKTKQLIMIKMKDLQMNFLEIKMN